MSLNVWMAVRIDEAAIKNSIDAEGFRAAEDLLAAGLPDGIAEVGGGASARVETGNGIRYDVWVGVVGGQLAGQCGCADPEELCVHVVAVTRAERVSKVVAQAEATSCLDAPDEYLSLVS